MAEEKPGEMEELREYLSALTILIGAMMAVLDEKVPDFRNELRSAIHRQHGHNASLTREIDLAFSVIDGLRHFIRN